MNIDAATESRTLLPALSDLPGHLVWRARARVVAALEDVLPDAVDIHAYAVLLALAGGASRSQRALADMVAVSGTTMMRVAASLAAEGLVERVRNPDDRRSYALKEQYSKRVLLRSPPFTTRRRHNGRRGRTSPTGWASPMVQLRLKPTGMC